jgi:hypothetical protein
MRSRQAGITFIGWVVLLVPVAIVFLAGLKLFPIYMNHFKVVEALKQTAESNRDKSNLSPITVRKELERRFDVEDVDDPRLDSILIERDGDEWVLVAEYDRETSLVGNVALTVHFNKRVVIQ